jgi:RNA polymerase-binding protein DksA
MNPVETNEFRDLLEAERRRVESALASLHDGGRANGDDEVADSGGVGADMATITVDRELDEGLEESATQMLALIEHAITRLDDGTYGTCERCGEAIAAERLRARPWAAFCIDDQRRADRG